MVRLTTGCSDQKQNEAGDSTYHAHSARRSSGISLRTLHSNYALGCRSSRDKKKQRRLTMTRLDLQRRRRRRQQISGVRMTAL